MLSNLKFSPLLLWCFLSAVLWFLLLQLLKIFWLPSPLKTFQMLSPFEVISPFLLIAAWCLIFLAFLSLQLVSALPELWVSFTFTDMSVFFALFCPCCTLSLDFQAHRASCLWGIFHVMWHGFLKSILNEYSLTWLLFGKLSLIPFPFLMCLGGILDRITLFLTVIFTGLSSLSLCIAVWVKTWDYKYTYLNLWNNIVIIYINIIICVNNMIVQSLCFPP